MFEDQDDALDISNEEPVFGPDELLTIEEFTSLTIDGWSMAADSLRGAGATEVAEEVESAIELLKNTYVAGEMINFEEYEKQMNSGPDTPATEQQ